MLTDLEYALKQLRPVLDRQMNSVGRDRVQRAIDALERCVEAAKARQPREGEAFAVDVAGMPIALSQQAVDEFTVTYWKQVKQGLTYDKAAAELGGCIMHALACDSKIDNRESGEDE